jgi:PAS domain S-box-containing protein
MTGSTAGQRLSRIVTAASAGMAGTGGLVLAGWALDAPALTRLLPGLPPSAPAAGAAFVLLGVALGCVGRPPVAQPGTGRRVGYLVGRALAALVALFGALVLVQYLAGVDLGTDRLLFPQAVRSLPTGVPGRPAPLAALAFLTGGLCLAFLDSDRRRGHRPAAVLTGLLAVTALVALLGHAYGAWYLRGRENVTGLSVSAALVSLLLVAGVLLARPDRPLAPSLAGGGAGGVLARRLGPALVALPFGIGLLQAAAGRAGLDDPATRVTLATLCSILVLLVLVARALRALDASSLAQVRLMGRLREERDLTTTLLHSLHDGVLVVSPDRRVVDANPRWTEMTGFGRTGTVGLTPPFPWWPPEKADEYLASTEDLVQYGIQGELEREYQRADGSRFPVLISTAPVHDADGHLRGYLSTYKDMTDRYRAAAALAGHAAKLREANEELEAANQFKTELMGMLSHEIGQPLTSITCFTELLTSQWEDLTDEQRLADVHRVETGARRLFHLVGELMLMFRLDAEAILAGRVSVDVAEAVETALARVPAPVQVRREVEDGLTALVDAGHLQQVLGNLLGNAARYGAAPVEVTAARGGDRAEIRVRDHGDGVPAEFVPHLFERFTRAGTGATVPGSGLGLFIVRRLVEASGGTVEYEPAAAGSCFVVRLDLDAGAEPRPVSDPVSVSQRSSRG